MSQLDRIEALLHEIKATLMPPGAYADAQMALEDAPGATIVPTEAVDLGVRGSRSGLRFGINTDRLVAYERAGERQLWSVELHS